MPYDNSQVEINGKTVGSVSGGTRWGGGLWINSEDLARFGLLVLNHGRWNGRQLVSAAVAQGRGDAERTWARLRLPVVAEHEAEAVAERARRRALPRSAMDRIRSGSIPEHDIVFVWHWHENRAMDGVIQRILAAVNDK